MFRCHTPGMSVCSAGCRGRETAAPPCKLRGGPLLPGPPPQCPRGPGQERGCCQHAQVPVSARHQGSVPRRTRWGGPWSERKGTGKSPRAELAQASGRERAPRPAWRRQSCGEGMGSAGLVQPSPCTLGRRPGDPRPSEGRHAGMVWRTSPSSPRAGAGRPGSRHPPKRAAAPTAGMRWRQGAESPQRIRGVPSVRHTR